MRLDIDFKRAVKGKDGYTGMIVFGQNERVLIQGVDGQKRWYWEDEITQADDTLKVEECEVEETCSCCGGTGKETVEEKRVVKK